MSTYHDTLTVCIDTYGDNWRAYYAASEIAYYTEHGNLPSWGYYIESVITEANGNKTFVHRDLTRVQ